MKSQLSEGTTFNKWTVIKDLGTRLVGSKRRHFILCKCSCENNTIREVNLENLNSGRSKCCGCEGDKKTIARNTKHGLIKEHKRAFNAWNAAIQRCTNPNNPGFKNYGGRGIKVCKRWLKFENFLKDMGDPPNNYELDRYPNNNGNYKPSNCRWTTHQENCNNRRMTIMITYKDRNKPLSYWSSKYKIPWNVLERRLALGWDIRKALKTPVRAYKQ